VFDVSLELVRVDLTVLTWVCIATAAALLTLRTLDVMGQHRARVRTRQAIERTLVGRDGR
jgi:hypothetical protein